MNISDPLLGQVVSTNDRSCEATSVVSPEKSEVISKKRVLPNSDRAIRQSFSLDMNVQ